MILRDPVHGLVAFDAHAEQVVTRLLATREVQRLRNVRQLGFTSLVFPGAEHSRFSHSIGSAHVMLRLLARLRRVQAELPPELRIDEQAEAEALAAALLHDLGHGPFSHLFEEILPGARHHESWTHQIIQDPSTDVHAALSSLARGMPERVVELLTGRHPLRYLGRVVSGTLDTDRCDYLLRDSHMTGVSYGVYDLDWLLEALAFAQCPTGEWVVAIEGRKGLPPLEGFFLARQFMYQQVYHHKATRAAETLIRGVFVRIAELVREGRAPTPTPAPIRRAALGEGVSLGEYLDLDDIELLSCFRAWERADDPVLSELTRRLSLRRLPKTMPLPEDGDLTGVWGEAHAQVSALAAARGLRADLAVWLDVPHDVPYGEPDDDSAEGLWVRLRHQPIQRLGRISFLLRELRNKRIRRPRLVFPEALREEAAPLLAGLLSPGGSA